MAITKKLSKKALTYLEYLRLQNKFNELQGRADRLRDDDDYVNSDAFDYAVKCAKPIASLEQLNEYYHNQITALIEKKRREDFYNTEDGKKYKAFFEEQINDVDRQLTIAYKQVNNELSTIVKGLLGDGWGVNFTPSTTEIGILDNESERNFIFGHDFTLFHNNHFSYFTEIGENFTIDTMQFNFSCGSMMGFDVFTDVNRREFEIGKGKFLENTEALLKIKQIIFDAIIKIKGLEKVYLDIKSHIDKPDMEYYNGLVSLAELKDRLSK